MGIKLQKMCRKVMPDEFGISKKMPVQNNKRSKRDEILGNITKKMWVASFLMFMTAVYLNFLVHDVEVVPIKNFSCFPKIIGQWSGVESFFDHKIYELLGVEDSFLINYQGPDGKIIQVYVGYYHSQRDGDLIHSPKNCMPGNGWNITQSAIASLPVFTEKNKAIKVIQLNLEKGHKKQIVLYWFQSRGRFIASEYLQKIYLVWDAIFKNRTDGAFVRLTAPVGKKGETYTIEYLKRFAAELIPVLKQYIPGENIIERPSN